MIKIVYITGSRSEYELCRGLLFELNKSSSFALELIVSGMHLEKNFGLSINNIHKDGFLIASVINNNNGSQDTNLDQFSNGLGGVCKCLKAHCFDLAIIVGDRIEAVYGAMACHFSGTPFYHIGGGHLTLGAIDDIYRYTVTQFAHKHFATTRPAFRNLLALPNIKNEDIIFSGSLSVDQIFAANPKSSDLLDIIPAEALKGFVLVSFHPATKTDEDISLLIKKTISELDKYRLNALVTYPNNDVGSDAIIKAIEESANKRHVYVSKNLGYRKYLAALKYCKFVIGNSSSLLSEAPYFNKYSLVVGDRQKGRAADSNVIWCPANESSLTKHIEIMIGFKHQPKNNHLYGNGTSISIIMEEIIKEWK